MRAAPPLSRLFAYPVTGGIGLLAAAVTLLTASRRWDLARFEVTPAAFWAEPWRIITSALPHALDFGRFDFLHLPFNLVWLWIFGTLLEDVWGHARTFALVVLFAAGSSLAEYALFRGGIGLSGVTYGLFGLLWALAPRDRRFAGGVDARTTRLMVGWFFLCIGATAAHVWAIANVAHAAGALLGALVGAVIAGRGAGTRIAAGVAVCAIVAGSAAGASTLRPRVNLARDAHGSSVLGYEAIQAGRFDDAVRHYTVAVRIDPKNAAAWYNLGIAHESRGRVEDAAAAYRRAYEVDPHDTRHRSAYLGACRRAGLAALDAGRHDDAIRLLEAASRIDAEDGVVWLALARAYDARGMADKAQDARTHAARRAPPRP